MHLVLRGATLVDGTGAPRRQADVEVVDGLITRIGEVGAVDGAEEIDLTGLVLTPGFVDIHTHFDAQVFWDADLTPSSWHGVTTVVQGNCGFGIAPARPAPRDQLRAAGGDPFRQRRASQSADRNDAFLAPLSENPRDPLVEVEIAQ